MNVEDTLHRIARILDVLVSAFFDNTTHPSGGDLSEVMDLSELIMTESDHTLVLRFVRGVVYRQRPWHVAAERSEQVMSVTS